MDEDDYRGLIELVKEQMASHGLSELGADENYLVFSSEDDESRLPAPHQHLLALLEAFRVHVKLTHRGTVEESLARIHEACSGEGPSAAEIILSREIGEGRDSVRVFLPEELPDRSEVLFQIEFLIQRLRDEPGPDVPTSRFRR
ncbi:hypothetical protein [Afifella sp. IM 167]|uniref:hypothetical protein n=1 Tax=Afifella sp. IM 167 TaxID=2033586 RepID=UPI001CCEF4E0|nr:hypothetical protein [Afifella sp. IM 167]MBZ8134387.1 hypothetical protein [Afifella sp. IM 167]